MVKVIVGYKLKENVDIQAILMKVRTHAMTFPGFVSAENLASMRDSSIILVIYTWEKIEDWRTWENTIIRKELLKEAEPLLSEQPRVRMYQVLSTTGWPHTPYDA